MSGYASNIYYIDDYQVELGEESAGKIGKVIGVIAAIVIPFAAPAIFGAIAASGALGAGIAAAASSGGFLGAVTGIVGSAVTGGIINAGVALATGGNIGQAFGQGALSGGLGGLGRGLGALNGASAAGQAGAVVKGGSALLPSAGTVGTGGLGSVAAGSAAITQSAATLSQGAVAGGSQIMSQLGNIFSGNGINQIGRALTNAIVNGESQERIDALAAQQRAALQTLSAQEQAAYSQRMQAAQQILADADRMDPAWQARVRMADVAGMEANQHRQAMRNIATRQGGSLDAGQRKAYERGSALHTARSKALVYNRGFTEAQTAQNQVRAQGAGLSTGPNFAPWQAGVELDAGVEQATRANQESTWGGFTDAIFGTRTPPQATSPDNSVPEDDDGQVGIFGGRG